MTRSVFRLPLATLAIGLAAPCSAAPEFYAASRADAHQALVTAGARQVVGRLETEFGATALRHLAGTTLSAQGAVAVDWKSARLELAAVIPQRSGLISSATLSGSLPRNHRVSALIAVERQPGATDLRLGVQLDLSGRHTSAALTADAFRPLGEGRPSFAVQFRLRRPL